MNNKLSLTKLFFIASIILIIFFLIIKPQNYFHHNEIEEEEEEEMPYLDITLLALGIVLIIVTYSITKKIGGVVRTPFVYFTASVFFFALLRLFYQLQEIHIAEASDTMVMIWWHLYFYIAMMLFFRGLILMKQPTIIAKRWALPRKDKNILIAAGILGIALIAFFFPLNDAVTSFAEGTLLDHSNGFLHFLAFVMGAFVVIALVDTKKYFGKTITCSFFPFVTAIFILSIVHLWELFTESWQAIAVPASIIDPVEASLFILAIFSFLFAYLSIKKKLRM